MSRATTWSESQMWAGLKLLGEPLGNGFTLRRLEAVAPGWPDIVGLLRADSRVTLVELKVLPANVGCLLAPGDPPHSWEGRVAQHGQRWHIPFRDAQPAFLRGWAADGGRAVVLCDVTPVGTAPVRTLVYLARPEPAWLRLITSAAPRPDAILTRVAKYAWPLKHIKEVLFPHGEDPKHYG